MGWQQDFESISGGQKVTAPKVEPWNPFTYNAGKQSITVVDMPKYDAQGNYLPYQPSGFGDYSGYSNTPEDWRTVYPQATPQQIADIMAKASFDIAEAKKQMELTNAKPLPTDITKVPLYTMTQDEVKKQTQATFEKLGAVVSSTGKQAPVTYTPKKSFSGDVSLADELNTQVQYIAATKDALPKEQVVDMASDVISIAAVASRTDKTIDKALPGLLDLLGQAGIAKSVLQEGSYYDVARAVTEKVADNTATLDYVLAAMGKIAPISMSQYQTASLGKVITKDDKIEIIAKALAAPGLGLSDKEIAKYSEEQPEVGIAIATGKVTLDEVLDHEAHIKELMTDQGGWIKKYPADASRALQDEVTWYVKNGMPGDYATALAAEALQSTSGEWKENIEAYVGNSTWNAELKDKMKSNGILGDAAAWFRKDENRILTTALSVGAGLTTGFLTGGPVGAIKSGGMGVFMGTEIANTLDSSIYAQNTLNKMNGAGITDVEGTFKNFQSRQSNNERRYNEALKGGDLVAAQQSLMDQAALLETIDSWTDQNALKLMLAGTYDDTKNYLAQGSNLLNDRMLTDQQLPGDKKPYTIKGFNPATDSITVYNKSMPGQSFIIENPTSDNFYFPPGEWEVKVTSARTGERFEEVSVTGTGSIHMGAVPESRLQAAKDIAEQAIDTQGAVQSSDVEKRMKFDKGVPVTVNMPEGWEVRNPETGVWSTSDEMLLHSPGTKTFQARQVGSDEVRYERLSFSDPWQDIVVGIDEYNPVMPEPYTPYKPAEQSAVGTTITFPGAKDERAVYYWDGIRFDPLMGQPMITGPGQHKLTIKKEGFQEKTETVTINAGKDNQFALATTLVEEKSGALGGGNGGGGGATVDMGGTPSTTIEFGPSAIACKVSFDGQDIAPKTGEKYSTQPGYHSVNIECTGGKVWRKTVYCANGENLYVSPAAGEFTGTETTTDNNNGDQNQNGDGNTNTEKVYNVSISVEPEGGKILINDAFTGEWTPGIVPLKKGYYKLGVYKSGYLKKEMQLLVDEVTYFGDAAIAEYQRRGNKV